MTRFAPVLIIAFLLILSARFFFFYKTRPKYSDGQYISFKTTLLSESQIFGNKQRFNALIDSTKISIVTTRYPEFHYGDSLIIQGKIQYKISKQHNQLLNMYYPKIEAKKEDTSPILAVTSFVRQKIISLFEATLPPTSSSLLLGIVFGIKEPIQKEFIDKLRLSGIMHIIAASGMNVTLVSGFLSGVFAFFLKRQLALVFSIIGIIFYAFLAGFEPSIIRASIMGILAFSAQILGRQRLAYYSLFMAGFVMLFASPTLIADVGFQLSFLATLGLLYLRPQLYLPVGKVPLVGEDIATTIAAQAATLPILLANFGTYSVWSVVVNALALWTVPPLMVLGGVGAMLGIISQPLGKIFLYLCLPFLLYLEKIVSVFTGFGGIVNLSNISWQFIFGYYLILLAIIIRLAKKHEY